MLARDLGGRPAAVALATVLLAAGVAGAAPQEPDPSSARGPATVETLAQLWQLSPAEAAEGRPILLTAVVTYYHHEWGMLFVQDATAGAYVYLDSRRPRVPIETGDLVEIEGRSVPGDFLPSIGEPKIRRRALVGLPEPHVVDLKQIATGSEDSIWIEVRGVVRTAAMVDGLLDLRLGMDGGELEVHVHDYGEPGDFSYLVDSVVRVRGVCSTRTNDKRQFLGAELWSPRLARDLAVEEPAPAEPFAEPPLSIDELTRYAFAGGHDRRLLVAGTVTLVQPERGVFLQDGPDGLFVETVRPPAVEPGDRALALGFLSLDGESHTLEHSLVRGAGERALVEPLAATADEALGGSLDGRLVTIRGRYAGPVGADGDQTLMLQDGDVVFTVLMQSPLEQAALDALEPGSLVAVTGVCSRSLPGSGTARAFQVLSRTPADLTVLSRPSWWTPNRLRALLALTAAVLLVAAAWAAMVRRRVRRQLRGKDAALQESEERFALAVQGTNDGIWDWDLVTDRLYLSPRWKSMLGYGEAEVGDRSTDWFRLVHPDDAGRLRAKIDWHCEGRSPHFEDEHRILHKSGTYRWVLSRGFALRRPDGRAYRMAGAQTDVTDSRYYDPLTKLPNRALFVERLERTMVRSQHAGGSLFAALFLDLDGFKIVNDSLGHLAGDRLLVAFARRIETCVRPADMVARFGGDEFAVLVDGLRAPGDAARVAERIHNALEMPFDLDGLEIYTTCSIGIALSLTGYDHADSLLRDADTAMYRAKAQGRAGFEVFDPAMRHQVTVLMQTENDLRRSLERGELRLHYQPIVDLATGEPVAFEALIRWQHPERGLIGPAEFLAVAEDTGLIVPIGWWVLGEACRQARRWQDESAGATEAVVSVNLSARQVGERRLVGQVEQALAATGLDPGRLVLEITESAVMESAASALANLTRLKELGIRLHLDDFGTGYSSLSYLHRLPIEALKVDRSFIATMEEREDARTIVRAILSLARNLRLSVIAEGIESEEQARTLVSLGCERGQGFLYAPALPPEAATGYLAAAPRKLRLVR